MTYTSSFPIKFCGTANMEAQVIAPGVRFTVLTPRLLRLEYSPDGVFEDRPSQAFWYRQQPVPQFEARREGEHIEIETDYLLLRYEVSDAGFSPQTLSITLKESGTQWQYGQADPLNLLGTTRTLDRADGALALEEGLLSRQGWAVYDDLSGDGASLVFNNKGWLEPRVAEQVASSKWQVASGNLQPATRNLLDLYFFGFGHDYQGALRDFAAVAGPAPMIPRWALGNWWSRYWAYTDKELLALMDEFRAHDVPLSVCIVDMDWHITDTGNACSGWTGYTWNRDLFPDPPAFIKELHQRGLKTALNLHPAEGVHDHEAQYAAMADRLGLDPAKKMPVPFDIADPDFASAYFELLHHPYEKDGVDFWWVDWQQGEGSSLPGLDPLWWLNHLHFYDLGRNEGKRPFVFSRWGGLGNHRYPIGFSGDTVVSWESLAFQPYFTATAANVNYGWWSHDIGGHMGGVEDAELYLRWVQFGVFSPIFRLHCTNNPFHERRPWGYDKHTETLASEAMRLRHALIPYIYTMAWRNHTQHTPLVRPMYHTHPAQEAAYHCPDQYWFGSELIVAPFISPAEESTRLSRQVVWLPEGEWFDFFDAALYEGDGWHSLYGRLEDLPVFARAGAIVPLARAPGLAVRDGWSETDNPEAFAIHLFPGADAASLTEFVLYEDDGSTDSCLTPISQAWSAQEWRVSVGPVEGDCDFVPGERAFSLCFRGVGADTVVAATLDGRPLDAEVEYDEETANLTVFVPAKASGEELVVTVSTDGDSLLLARDHRPRTCRRMVRAFKLDSWVKQRLDRDLPAILDEPRLLANYQLALTGEQTRPDPRLRALAEVATGSGFHRGPVRQAPLRQAPLRQAQGAMMANEEAIILWNNNESDAVSFNFVAEDFNHRPEIKSGPLPKFAVLHVGENVLHLQSGDQPAGGQITVGEWFDSLAGRVGTKSASGTAVVQFDILGPLGRTAYLTLKDGASTGSAEAALSEGEFEKPDVTITAESDDWLALINGQISPEEAFLSGKIQVAGTIELVLQMVEAISFTPPSTYLADRWRFEVNYLDMLTVAVNSIQ